MQITDQQFIDAMSLAVKEKGGHNTAPGAYWSPVQGAYCIVGYALWKIDQGLCPKTNQHMAHTLLTQLGCSKRVAESAYAAQYANDMSESWAVCLEVFEYALKAWRPDHDLGDFVHRAVFRGRERRARVVIPQFYAHGGTIKKTIEWDEESIKAFNGACIATTAAVSAYSACFEEFATLTGGLVSTQVLTKKEHALTA